MTEDKFVRILKGEHHKIVSANDLSEVEIAVAEAEDRMFVSGDGLGYVVVRDPRG